VNVDLAQLFTPSLSIVEIFIRGSIMYLALFAMLRLTRGRYAGGLSMADLLVIVLIADAAQNALAGDYTSITDGLVLVGTIVGWAYAIDWLSYHSRRIGRLIHPPPLLLVEDGKPLRNNLRGELITMDELMTYLRAEGLENVSQAKRVFVEGNGSITVIAKEGQGN